MGYTMDAVVSNALQKIAALMGSTTGPPRGDWKTRRILLGSHHRHPHAGCLRSKFRPS